MGLIFVIDNYDSFTYNLVQMLEATDREVLARRNDQISLDQMKQLNPAALVISPGPGTPKSAGICVEAIRYFAPRIPILGVCLGHQAIAVAFGARVVRAPRIMHGKTSLISHDGKGVFEDLPDPFEATRYHSLIVDRRFLPYELVMSAWTAHGEVMGIRHVDYPVEGVQFHPESILTSEGKKILENFVSQNHL
mgnify:CR=1 FL=1